MSEQISTKQESLEQVAQEDRRLHAAHIEVIDAQLERIRWMAHGATSIEWMRVLEDELHAIISNVVAGEKAVENEDKAQRERAQKIVAELQSNKVIDNDLGTARFTEDLIIRAQLEAVQEHGP